MSLAAWLEPELDPIDRMARGQKLADHLAAGTLDLPFVLSQVPDPAPRYLLVVDQYEEAFGHREDSDLRRVFLETLLDAAEQPHLTVILTVRSDFSGYLLAEPRLGARADPGTLLRKGILAEAERWRGQHPQGWSDAELAYLAACRAGREAEETGRWEQIKALEAANTATKKALRMARSRELAAHALTELNRRKDPSGSLALMLAREAVRATLSQDEEVAVVVQDALQRATDSAPPFRLKLPRRRHAGLIHTAAFSPDGRLVITASADQTARIFDAATSAELCQLQGHSASVWSAAFSSDGCLVVTASEDQTARIWDAATGAELRQLQGHSATVRSSAFSPDSRLVVTVSEDQTARLFDATTGVELRQLHGHSATVNSAAFSPDSRLVVTASDDQTARLWDAATSAELCQLWGHSASVRCAVFSPNGRLVVTASADQTARLWDAATGAELRQLQGHFNWVLSAAFSPDGRFVVTASADQTARIWDVATGAELRQLQGHSATVNSAAFSPDGHRVVTASTDKTTRLWLAWVDDLLTLALSLVQRDPSIFTPEERRRFGLDK